MAHLKEMSIPNRKWTRRTLLSHAILVLEEAGIEDARRNAEWIAEEVLNCSRLAIYAGPDESVSIEQVEKLLDMVSRRIYREPLQYILGHTDFYGLRLRVTPDVLIPRPETEQVVEYALGLLRNIQAPRVLDIGTGSGCIALTIKHERSDATVFACDVSEQALRVARENARDLRLDVTFFQANILSDAFTAHAPPQLDLVISNPPYIPLSEAGMLDPEVVRHEPHQALFSGDDPLTFYRAITRQASALLQFGGFLVVEVHADYGSDVQTLLSDSGFTGVQVLPDLAGKPRIAAGRFEGQ